MDKQPMNELTAVHSASPSAYSNENSFELAQRMAKHLASSTIVPKEYQGNISNTMIALEIANRTNSSPMMVMQNLHIIQGRPSWSSSFIIAALNSCGRFAPLRFRVEDKGTKTIETFTTEWVQGQKQRKAIKVTIQDKACVAYTKDANGDALEGPEATIEMAVREGWYTKADSKWQTMPDLMLRYRAAAFFGRLYAPDVLMGMHTFEEVNDIGAQTLAPEQARAVEILNAKIKSSGVPDAEVIPEREDVEQEDEDIV